MDRKLTRQAASRVPRPLAQALSVVEEAAQGTKLWCGVTAVLAWLGGRRGRRAGTAGLVAVAVAQLVSNGMCKPLADRPRPPKGWIPHDEVEDRPDSSSFPSGHTAAAVAFAAAAAPAWPLVGALCAVPAAVVAVERVQSGAHYPSDVAAGAVIGLGAAWFTRWSPRLLRRCRSRSVPACSYGWAHHVLTMPGVILRGRGGTRARR
ncbi:MULTISPECIES: phosphatase PAP2 family protein [Streptomyces]|uniref:phosphatase PAP2 family protein n=1 Tax=Streptomyces TaxID=1883 RepID=UPI001E476F33|nr:MULTISPECIES: phosphatase PAP2 family protein [Streptomyces]